MNYSQLLLMVLGLLDYFDDLKVDLFDQVHQVFQVIEQNLLNMMVLIVVLVDM